MKSKSNTFKANMETKFCYSDENKYVFGRLSTLPGSTAPLDEYLADCACNCASASAVLTPFATN